MREYEKDPKGHVWETDHDGEVDIKGVSLRGDRPAGDVLPLRVERLAQEGATWWDKATSRAWLALGKLLARLGVPGGVAPVEIDDPVTGYAINIAIGPLFTRVQVNGRDFYFDRFTGRFDGTGQGCR